VPLSNCVPRGFGFVHHSIAILCYQVPNPNLTILLRRCTQAAGRSSEVQFLTLHQLQWDVNLCVLTADIAQSKVTKVKRISLLAGASPYR
jgi:hypothetical protein